MSEEVNAVRQTDLQIAFANLASKKPVYDLLWKYYDGDHDLKYATERLKDVFGTTLAKFVENWCAVVVDTAWERLELQGFEVGSNEEARNKLEKAWKDAEMDLDAADAHLAALVTGESFVVVWPDADEHIRAYYNDPRLCHVQYDEEDPRRKKWAAKWWALDSGTYRMNLYYPDRIKYFATEPMSHLPTAVGVFKPMDPPEASNPYGQVPVFHLRRQRRTIASELSTSVLSMQDAVDKLLSDLMITAEFGAFPQRYIISNSDTDNLKNAPNEIWSIPSGDGMGQAASVGQLAAAALSNYIEGISHLINAVSAVSRTPRHFFFGDTGQLSGEALIALEAPLNKKCDRYTQVFGNTWQRVAAFILLLLGYRINEEDITPVWAPVETVQPRTRAEIRKIDVEAGIPLTTSLRREGWSESDLRQLEKDRAEEAARSSASLARALVEQQRQFDQGTTPESTVAPTSAGEEADAVVGEEG